MTHELRDATHSPVGQNNLIALLQEDWPVVPEVDIELELVEERIEEVVEVVEPVPSEMLPGPVVVEVKSVVAVAVVIADDPVEEESVVVKG
jgi:uncharacterized protein (UPF0216 family)